MTPRDSAMSFRKLSSLLSHLHRTRAPMLTSFRVSWLFALLLVARAAWAAPEAKLLRIDPRASLESGHPIITTVIEVAQIKRVSEAVADCAGLANDAQLDCMRNVLEKPNGRNQAMPFPAKKALFLVSV